jgi:antitoxin (DNA-binding transcriptional repressor) of toxin-antitoxin stability system
MIKISEAGARRHLSSLIVRAEKGERVVITRNGKPVVEIRLTNLKRSAIFAAEARRQSKLLNESPHAEEDQALVDAIQEFTNG